MRLLYTLSSPVLGLSLGLLNGAQDNETYKGRNHHRT
jgi:hypothetical protein